MIEIYSKCLLTNKYHLSDIQINAISGNRNQLPKIVCLQPKLVVLVGYIMAICILVDLTTLNNSLSKIKNCDHADWNHKNVTKLDFGADKKNYLCSLSALFLFSRSLRRTQGYVEPN